MDLKDIRKDIDAIDLQLRDLIMRRMDCSHAVAEAKRAAGSTEVYRADREQAILDTLGADVPDDRRAEYLAVVRKVMESSRMYQYGLLYAWNPAVFDEIPGSELTRVAPTPDDEPAPTSGTPSCESAPTGDTYSCDPVLPDEAIGSEPTLFGETPCNEPAYSPAPSVTLRLTIADRPGALAAILGMVGDYGYDIQEIDLDAPSESSAKVTFYLVIRGNTADDHMRQMLFQLSKESSDFRILAAR